MNAKFTNFAHNFELKIDKKDVGHEKNIDRGV